MIDDILLRSIVIFALCYFALGLSQMINSVLGNYDDPDGRRKITDAYGSWWIKVIWGGSAMVGALAVLAKLFSTPHLSWKEYASVIALASAIFVGGLVYVRFALAAGKARGWKIFWGFYAAAQRFQGKEVGISQGADKTEAVTEPAPSAAPSFIAAQPDSAATVILPDKEGAILDLQHRAKVIQARIDGYRANFITFFIMAVIGSGLMIALFTSPYNSAWRILPLAIIIVTCGAGSILQLLVLIVRWIASEIILATIMNRRWDLEQRARARSSTTIS